MRAATDWAAKNKDWQHAGVGADNLSELELTLGDVAGALRDAEQSVTFADRSGEAFQRMVRRTTHAYALHHAGRRAEALALFREAERMQAELQPEYALLYSLQGFECCDLFLAEAERAAWQLLLNRQSTIRNPQLKQVGHSVSRRAAQTLRIAERNNWLLVIALDHLTLGRAALYQAMLDGSAFRSPPSALQPAHRELAAAVDGLRAAGQVQELPRSLLTRAWLRVVEGDAAGARADLDEAWQIAERGAMKLFMADVHLHRVRLFRDKDELAKARDLIEACRYWRRKEELEDAEAAAKSWPDSASSADEGM